MPVLDARYPERRVTQAQDGGIQTHVELRQESQRPSRQLQG